MPQNRPTWMDDGMFCEFQDIVKKECNTTIIYNMSESWKHYATMKETNINSHILHNTIHMKYLE